MTYTGSSKVSALEESTGRQSLLSSFFSVRFPYISANVEMQAKQKHQESERASSAYRNFVTPRYFGSLFAILYHSCRLFNCEMSLYRSNRSERARGEGH
jgi:hypothetical protein